MNQAISLNQTRRNNLLKIMANKGFRSITAFAKHYGLFTSNLSLILNGNREFTDRLAKNIESKLGIEHGSLSRYEAINDECYLINNFDIIHDNNHIEQLKDNGTFLSINKNLMELDKDIIKNLISLPANSKLDREALSGTINKNSSLIFDRSQVQLATDKIYLIDVAGKLLVRKLALINDEEFFVTNQPDIYKEISISQSITILGMLIFEINTVVKH